MSSEEPKDKTPEYQDTEQDILERLVIQLQDSEVRMRVNRAYEAAQEALERNSPIQEVVHDQRFSKSRRALNIELLKREYADGQSLRQLAAKYKVDRKTVALQLRKAGVVLRKPGSNVWRGEKSSI